MGRLFVLAETEQKDAETGTLLKKSASQSRRIRINEEHRLV